MHETMGVPDGKSQQWLKTAGKRAACLQNELSVEQPAGGQAPHPSPQQQTQQHHLPHHKHHPQPAS